MKTQKKSHFLTKPQSLSRSVKVIQWRRWSPKAKGVFLYFWTAFILCYDFNLSWFAHPEHKLLLCHMGKHGSTTWARCLKIECGFQVYVNAQNFLGVFKFMQMLKPMFQLLLLHVHRTRARGSRSLDADSGKEMGGRGIFTKVLSSTSSQ